MDTEVRRKVLDAKVGLKCWTQRFDAEVGRQRLDTADGCRGWTHRVDMQR